MTNVLMIIITLSLFALLAVNAKYKDDCKHFFNKENTNALRGFWCIVIVLAHVVESKQNTLQDTIGSFAFIGVTFFFLTSAYGLKTGVFKDKNYINHFWFKRLVKLLIPCLITNFMLIASEWLTGVRYSFGGFFHSLGSINQWVLLLLVCYVIFYLVYLLGMNLDNLKKDVIICIFILAYSLFSYFCKDNKLVIGWPYELLGFSYGLLLFDFKDKFVLKINDKWKESVILFGILSLIVGVMYLKSKTIYFVGEYLLKIILGIVITLLILSLNARISLSNRVNQFLGNISFEVYLLHNASFVLLQYYLPDLESGVFIVLSLIITIILSCIAYLVSNLINKKVFKI